MLEPGHYANLFEVKIAENKEITVMACDRKRFPTLKALRDEISKENREVFVYAPEMSDKVYGYGIDLEWLALKGFEKTKINLSDEPRLTGRMILDAFIDKAKKIGYLPYFSRNEIGRCTLCNWDKFQTTSDGNVKVYTGYDIRVIFLKDGEKDRLCFNIIIDACYKLRDNRGEPLNNRTIIARFGRETLRNVRKIQGDLIPTGKINTEVSRKILIDEILPFIETLKEIELPCGIRARMKLTPSRIILGE